MEKEEYEARIDSINREDIWKPEVEKWLENFKSEETPIEKRITDYRINGYGTNSNNDNKILMNINFEVTPVDANNTSWDTPQRNVCYLEMTKQDGEYKLEYIGEVPKNYDKFLKEFENWQEENKTVEMQTVQGEKKELSADKEIDKMSNGIIFVCTILIAVVIISTIIKIVKRKKK